MLSDLNVSHGKMSDFVSFPLFWSSLVAKLRNFDFEGRLNTRKKIVSDLNMSCQTVSDLV